MSSLSSLAPSRNPPIAVVLFPDDFAPLLPCSHGKNLASYPTKGHHPSQCHYPQATVYLAAGGSHTLKHMLTHQVIMVDYSDVDLGEADDDESRRTADGVLEIPSRDGGARWPTPTSRSLSW